jgi:GNAT superfamily N-acetyltransferase
VGRGAVPPALSVRRFSPADLGWAEPLVVAELGGRWQARRGEQVDGLQPPGWVAERDGVPVGLLTAAARDDGWELVLLVATERRAGVASMLVGRLLDEARRAGADRVWVVTTNDNLGALAFYQRLGFRLSVLRPGAVDEARATRKPEIPTTGQDGLPLRDELELVFPLSPP